MPEYEFICEKCNHSFSLIMRITEYDKKEFSCPQCKSKKVKRKLSSFHAHTSKKS
jgi:putative FmdB family regulatory protein